MRNSYLIFVLLTLATTTHGDPKSELYRPPSAGDAGAYYIISVKRETGPYLRAVTSRVGKNKAYTDFTEIRVNCDTKQYRYLAGASAEGYHLVLPKKLTPGSKDKWTNIIRGSSKYDAVTYLCAKNYGHATIN